MGGAGPWELDAHEGAWVRGVALAAKGTGGRCVYCVGLNLRQLEFNGNYVTTYLLLMPGADPQVRAKLPTAVAGTIGNTHTARSALWFLLPVVWGRSFTGFCYVG